MSQTADVALLMKMTVTYFSRVFIFPQSILEPDGYSRATLKPQLQHNKHHPDPSQYPCFAFLYALQLLIGYRLFLPFPAPTLTSISVPFVLLEPILAGPVAVTISSTTLSSLSVSTEPVVAPYSADLQEPLVDEESSPWNLAGIHGIARDVRPSAGLP